MSDNNQTQRELDDLKGKLIKVVFGVIGIALLLIIIIPISREPLGGLYMVAACNNSGACYTLRANVSNGNREGDDGQLQRIWEDSFRFSEGGRLTVDNLLFSNGGKVELDCLLDSFCYEIDSEGLKRQGDNTHWDIKLLKRLGNSK